MAAVIVTSKHFSTRNIEMTRNKPSQAGQWAMGRANGISGSCESIKLVVVNATLKVAGTQFHIPISLPVHRSPARQPVTDLAVNIYATLTKKI